MSPVSVCHMPQPLDVHDVTGLDNASGSLKAVLAQAPPDAACPECRQQGIFEGALLMKKLAGAINRRCSAITAEALHTCFGCSNFGSLGNVLERFITNAICCSTCSAGLDGPLCESSG